MDIAGNVCYFQGTMNRPLLTFYGDDFTGSTDALEALSLGGVRTALFLEPPTAEMVARRFGQVDAVGLAGMSRTMTPAEMDEALPGAFEALRQLGAPLCHYKVCSTFDSSPEVGNIGRAVEIGSAQWQSPFVPLLAGAPPLRRFLLFGHLFAAAGETVYRLDRHPTMSRHPVTPMAESDLRRHLSRQTSLRMGLVDILAVEQGAPAVRDALQAALDGGAQIVFFDTLNAQHGATIGGVLWQRSQQSPLFVVGSSGVEYALAAAWQAAGIVARPGGFPALAPVDRLLVMSGSASPVTAAQIGWALENGFAGIRLDVPRLLDAGTAEEAEQAAYLQARAALDRGQSVALYSARGPDDEAIVRAPDPRQSAGGAGRALAMAQGRITRRLIETTGLQRACVAGGDTCGFVAQQLELVALEMLAPVAPGGPLCRAHARAPRMDGLEIALKGGQLGQVDYFGRLLRGS